MKLKSGMWVAAQLRQCDLDARAIVVRQRGDADSGSILLRLDRLNGHSTVLTQIYDAHGEPCWLRATGPEDVVDKDAEDYLARRQRQDPDIWILEIEDPHKTFETDAPVVS